MVRVQTTGAMGRSRDKAVAVVVITCSAGSISAGYWLARRFRRRLKQSHVLRDGQLTRPDAVGLAVGEYVRVRGTVSAGARKLQSPMKGVDCVAYRVNVVRVVDSRTAKKEASVTGVSGLIGTLSSLVPWLFSFATTAKVDTEKWDTVYQPISKTEEKVEVYVEDAATIAALEAMAQAGQGKRRPRVRVDLAGAEFFTMDEVASSFEQETSPGANPSSRTHLGYRTTEEVLAVGSRITVLGEVAQDPEGDEGDVVLRKAAPKSILDLKTASISRPFVVSTKSEQGLLEEIERSGRIYFWLAVPSIAIGIALAYVGGTFVRALADESPDAPEHAPRKDSAAGLPPSRGWRGLWSRV